MLLILEHEMRLYWKMVFQRDGCVLEIARSSGDSFGMSASPLVKGIGNGRSLKRVDKVLGGIMGT